MTSRTFAGGNGSERSRDDRPEEPIARCQRHGLWGQGYSRPSELSAAAISTTVTLLMRMLARPYCQNPYKGENHKARHQNRSDGP
jgi:hypothetical protein